MKLKRRCLGSQESRQEFFICMNLFVCADISIERKSRFKNKTTSTTSLCVRMNWKKNTFLSFDTEPRNIKNYFTPDRWKKVPLSMRKWNSFFGAITKLNFNVEDYINAHTNWKWKAMHFLSNKRSIAFYCRCLFVCEKFLNVEVQQLFLLKDYF